MILDYIAHPLKLIFFTKKFFLSNYLLYLCKMSFNKDKNSDMPKKPLRDLPRGTCMVCLKKTNKEDYVCDDCIMVRNHIVKHGIYGGKK